MLEPSRTKFDEMNEWIVTKLKKKISFSISMCCILRIWWSVKRNNHTISQHTNTYTHSTYALSMCTWNYFTFILLTFQNDIWMMAIQFGDFCWMIIYKLFFIVFFHGRYEYIWNKIMPSNKPLEQLQQKIKLNQYMYWIEIWNQTFKFHIA